MGKNKKGDGAKRKARKEGAADPGLVGAEEMPPEELEELIVGEEDKKSKKRDADGNRVRTGAKKAKAADGEDSGGEAEAAAAGGKARQEALDYLDRWDFDRGAWKFQKVRQAWLLAHALSKTAVPKRTFGILLRYCEGLKGAARTETLAKATEALKKKEGGEGDSDGEGKGASAEEVAEAKRAKKLILVLQEG